MSAWDEASYEVVARQLEPAAAVVAGHAAPQAGERALDVGCGTGNATVLLAAAGAAVTAVDPGERLLRVARERVGGELETAVAGAEDLPFGDGAFDVVVSVFAAVFSPDPERAVAELVRVTRPGGRAVLSAWPPGTSWERATAPLRTAMAELDGAVAPGWPWHDPAALEPLLPAGATLETHHHDVTFSAPSASALVDDLEASHPMFQTPVARLRGAGRWAPVRAAVTAGLAAESAAADRLEVPIDYVVHVVRP